MNQNQNQRTTTYHSNLVYDRFGELRKVLKLLGSKQGRTIRRSESETNQFLQWLDNIQDGTMIVSEYKILRPSKSYQQVKTHFGLLLNTIIAKANDEGIDTSAFLKLIIRDDLPTGIGLTKDFLHELFYCLCPVYDDNGRRITLSKMNTEQASKWLDECRNLMASRGIYIPDPDPNWKEK